MATFKAVNSHDNETHTFIIADSDPETENTNARHWVINHLDLSKSWTTHRVKIVLEKELYQVYFTYGEHEMESDIYAGELGTTTEAREYLMYIHTSSDGDGYMQDALEDRDLLVIESVRKFDTVHDKTGAPYKVALA